MSAAMTVEQVREMASRGMSDREIGDIVGRERRTVQSFRRKHGIPPSGPVGRAAAYRKERAAPLPATVPEGVVAAVRGKPITIAEFLLNKRRAVCPVCQLKEPVRSIVADARKNGERQADIIEYLHVVHRTTITPREFASHVAGRHDQ